MDSAYTTEWDADFFQHILDTIDWGKRPINIIIAWGRSKCFEMVETDSAMAFEVVLA